MKLRISRHLDVKMIAGLGANERHQFVGVLKLADAAHAGGQVAAQRHDAFDAHFLVGIQDAANVFARRADARQVRCSVVTFGLDLPYGVHRAVLRGAARAEGDGKKLGLERRQTFARGREFFHAFRSLRRKKFKTEKLPGHRGLMSFSFAIWLICHTVHLLFGLINCAAAEDSAQEKILYSTAPNTPCQKLSTTKPRSTEPTSQNNVPLMTKMNKPNVTSVTGNVSSSNNGRIKVLTSPRKNAAISAEPKPSTCMPGTKFATASNASALSAQMSSNSTCSFICSFICVFLCRICRL